MRSDPWLSEPQQRAWRSFLMVTAALDERIERDMQQAAGMPHAYFLALAMLSEAQGRTMRMSQLAEMAQMSQSRLSHAVARLEEKGWVRRTRAAEDRRGQFATLTDAGFKQLEEVAPSHAETVRSFMFDPLSPAQLAALQEICSTILEHMDELPGGWSQIP